MQVEVVTLFPALIEAGLSAGVVGRARSSGLLRVGTENPRDHATDAHRTVDDRPFGGGPGMVLAPGPLATAIRAARARLPEGAPMIALSAQGPRFAQAAVRRLAGLPGFGLVAGRYEGIDQRVADALIDEELSIGDYVLSGGELPALVVIDAVARLLPGVLGDAQSAGQDSFSDGLLDWPHYTRPESWEGRPVPPVLLGGNHAAIARWRLKQSLGRTWRLRPELLAGRPLAPAERALLEEYCAEAGIEPPRT
ncbi:MAG TPA: tRNA (guanosine(37)-N1)-methyltransferase TrmD [Steroidobacteraceae bacterium]|nr:tRNA (guanosine(37)-N1)-methyltransferase TrmD [Steroidobacteraceae bacterium]